MTSSPTRPSGPMIDQSHILKIATELRLNHQQVRATIELLDSGSTVPFVARYRKEITGSLDEVAISSIRDRIKNLRELDKRKETILASIEQQGKLTPDLKEKILAVEALSVLEDIYLPFRPKRRTRATIARERGLEPLAQLIFEQKGIDLQKEAERYIDLKKKVLTQEDALSGARDIMAEWINENTEARLKIRELYFEKGIFKTQVIREKEKEGQNYRDYFDWQDKVKSILSHRLLAIRRAEKEEILMLKILVPEEEALKILEELFMKGKGEDSRQVQLAIQDSFKRLLSLSMETEIRVATKEQADREAIKVFAKNLRELLMEPPLGQKSVMAIDPAYRTGCKVVCLDKLGNLLHHELIYPTGSQEEKNRSAKIIQDLVERFKMEYIAIGNGTASRETEDFIRQIGLPESIPILIVSEAGASVYSASEVAREEFPKQDVTVRGAVSIGRRLMDPLAELVKIDPQSIGVGQYQHDVDQGLLKDSLDDVVISCVNQVGVELNTASKELLTYVSGLGPARAQALINYRNTNGSFRSRLQLTNVPGLGPKAFEQAAGFLRIRESENPLDASSVHPESYFIVDMIAKDLGCRINDLMKIENLRNQIILEKYVTEKVGLPTLSDMKAELAKPGRDPREQFEIFRFKEGIRRPEDLRPGMKLEGVVTNITNFGCFVDIGVHLDGLVHLSQLSDRYVKSPYDVVKVHQKVTVTVLEVDLERKRIALSMRNKIDFLLDK